jgi:hypothetical protein
MGSKQTTTQRADPWAPAQPFILKGLKDASALYKEGGFNIQPYGGDMVAGYDPMRAQADAGVQSAYGNALSMAGQGRDALTNAMDPNARSAGWNTVVQNTINSIMPGINSSFAGSGMTGSGLHAQNLAKGLSAGIADVENQAWQQGQNRALQAAGMLPQMAGMEFNAADALRAAGADRQQQQQQEISADVLRDQQAKTSELSAIQDYLALVSGVGGQFGSQSSTQRGSPGLLGVMGGLFSGLGGIAQAGGFPALFSDRRLKEDIKRVGETDEGLGIFTYKYKGNPTTHMGVMAQDVQKVKPEAVKKVGGYLAVDYGAI